ncbi:MAG TPA: hypothetical protein VFO39_22460 [Candidatus Sulfotelmatobacter sp.]|nr:hypothetical protein [Candidatus Sulfotelmatobacter sp.]
MKRSAHLFIAVCTLFLTTLALAQTDAQKSFTQLKSLTGEWQGTASDNHPVTVSFRETAGGSALLSEIQGHGPEQMISMIHMDGPNKLMLTHYCGAGNQPRMQALSSPDGKSVTFNFLDATNLASPDAGHMQSVTIAMLDANHHTEEWTFNDHGNTHKMVFDLRRK